MVLDVNRSDVVERMLKMHRALLMLVYNSNKDSPEYIRKLSEVLSPAFEPHVPLVRVDVSSDSKLLNLLEIEDRMLPMLILFLEGVSIWRQYGLFYNLAYDKQAVRIGVKRALEVRGLKPRDLGLNLANLLL
ncbi:hypothetical protein Pyrfu_0103 [Pyrolobus fumarii 1A]|uniref:Uncharacterized protein n=1 Tax=Pyrolobus fumarii (strain DSM 11204 / 1A) TaxID=694429 RepID=G0EED4_PYRF1|nr:hypothetical protein [Pyrolobus fumarii]AEM37975.1 hypothetical protein Pyrfu_0103 [Pyrolobus fumarii 1A]